MSWCLDNAAETDEDDDTLPAKKKSTKDSPTKKSTFQQAVDQLQGSKSGVSDSDNSEAVSTDASMPKKITFKIDDRAQAEASSPYKKVRK